MKLCLIIVTYNRVHTLVNTMANVNLQSVKADYILVVNNGSRVDTKSFLDGFTSFQIWPVHLPVNLGYGYGLSMGMKWALANFTGINYFLLMDDDSHPKSGYFKLLLEARQIINEPGMLGSVGFVDYLWKGPVPISKDPQKKSRLISNDPLIYKVDHVLVDGTLVDRVVVEKVGTPREDVFMMCEDLEYSKRIKRAGYAISALHSGEAVERLHLGGGDRFSFSTRWRGYYHARNHLMILKKYFTLKMLLMYTIRQTKYLLAGLLAPDRMDRVRLRLLGIYHGLIGKMGKIIDPESYKKS